MSILSAEQRRFLDGVVQKARVTSELAARHQVERLGVLEPEAGTHLTGAEVALREDLRAKATELGDAPSTKGALLVADIGYEQWHRLLFARFLAANDLLQHPGYGISVTLEECAELAAGLGEPDAWSVAARFASETLPGVFRPTDPSVRVRYAAEDLGALVDLVSSLGVDLLRAEDALGWVYQYWQTAQKKLVNATQRKIGGADISPVTQLFTEDYMVRFLLENSLGAWWAGRHPESPLLDGWGFLRRDDGGRPAAGMFHEWPATAAGLSILDPCCGSGHFLVAAFGMLWRMRAEEEGLDPVAAQDAVLRDNLFGLELDPRCTQLAAFSLVLEAWKQGGHRLLPPPQVVCSGVPVPAGIGRWVERAGGDARKKFTFERLHEQFRTAHSLGSLIDPSRAADSQGLLSSDIEDALELLDEVATDASTSVLGSIAADVLSAARLLARRYSLVATNVPYLKRASMASELQEHVDRHHASAKQDLATVFVQRCLAFTEHGGTVAIVAPQNWLFLTSYRAFREEVLTTSRVDLVARLGTGAFTSISGEVVNVALDVLSTVHPPRQHEVAGVLAHTAPTIAAKRRELAEGGVVTVTQQSQRDNPDSRITLTVLDRGSLLQAHASGLQGISTTDYPRFGRCFWERPLPHPDWERQQSTVPTTTDFGGREHILWWEGGNGALSTQPGVAIRGKAAWGRPGVAVSQMGDLSVTRYTGELFDGNIAVVLPSAERDLDAVWAFCSSPEFRTAVREIDAKMNVTNATLVKVPFELERWRAVAAAAGASPEPSSTDPTQWLFRGHPRGADNPLQVAVARLLGHRWPDQEPDELDDLADDDGIVALPAVGNEDPAADRLRSLLARAHGGGWSQTVLDGLLTAAGGYPDLESWLRDGFFAQHATLFHHRPFVWQVWDGLKRGGFSALLDYHRLTTPVLEKLTYATLGDWISRQQSDAEAAVPGADTRLAAARTLRTRLESILEGEHGHDVFVRWKPLHEQPLGWDPDLDDGVRVNIRPFVLAGILRSKVNVSWGPDRGSGPSGSARVNDTHLTLAEKRHARRLHP